MTNNTWHDDAERERELNIYNWNADGSNGNQDGVDCTAGRGSSVVVGDGSDCELVGIDMVVMACLGWCMFSWTARISLNPRFSINRA